MYPGSSEPQSGVNARACSPRLVASPSGLCLTGAVGESRLAAADILEFHRLAAIANPWLNVPTILWALGSARLEFA
jgi:hypothetical protein